MKPYQELVWVLYNNQTHNLTLTATCTDEYTTQIYGGHANDTSVTPVRFGCGYSHLIYPNQTFGVLFYQKGSTAQNVTLIVEVTLNPPVQVNLTTCVSCTAWGNYWNNGTCWDQPHQPTIQRPQDCAKAGQVNNTSPSMIVSAAKGLPKTQSLKIMPGGEAMISVENMMTARTTLKLDCVTKPDAIMIWAGVGTSLAYLRQFNFNCGDVLSFSPMQYAGVVVYFSNDGKQNTTTLNFTLALEAMPPTVPMTCLSCVANGYNWDNVTCSSDTPKTKYINTTTDCVSKGQVLLGGSNIFDSSTKFPYSFNVTLKPSKERMLQTINKLGKDVKLTVSCSSNDVIKMWGATALQYGMVDCGSSITVKGNQAGGLLFYLPDISVGQVTVTLTASNALAAVVSLLGASMVLAVAALF